MKSRQHQAIDRKSAATLFNLGDKYLHGQGVPQDEKRAAVLYQQAADQGHANAQFNLGILYTEGVGVAKDIDKAIALYKQAADQGFVDAQFTLGNIYFDGIDVPKDEVRAAMFYQQAVDQRDRRAQHNLGGMYERGQGVAKDIDKALALYQQAADQGSAYSQYWLAGMYEKGRGVVKDEKRAIVLYQQAVDQGYIDAQVNLGNMYLHGRGVPKDEKKAMMLYQQAADQGHAIAQFNLGVMYANGKGISKDDGRAAMLYQQAADQGLAEAQYNLGYMYEDGIGVSKDESRAAVFYQQAANQGHASAQCCLGSMYEDGRGVVKDEVRAAILYQQAADQGNESAQYSLGRMYEYGLGVANDESRAVMLYQQAADQGLANAQYNLGYMYENGRGVAKDIGKAVVLYQQANDQETDGGCLRLLKIFNKMGDIYKFYDNSIQNKNIDSYIQLKEYKRKNLPEDITYKGETEKLKELIKAQTEVEAIIFKRFAKSKEIVLTDRKETTDVKIAVIGGYLQEQGAKLIEAYIRNFKKYALKKFYVQRVHYELALADHLINLELKDISYTKNYSYERRKYLYREMDVFIMIYSVLDLEFYDSFLERWNKGIKDLCPNTPCILVASDIESRSDSLQKINAIENKPITYAQGVQLARKIGAISYKEFSFLSSGWLQDVRDIFATAIMTSILGREDSDWYKDLLHNAQKQQKIKYSEVLKRRLAVKHTIRRPLVLKKTIPPPPPRSYFLSEKHPNRKSTWGLDAFSEMQKKSENPMLVEENEDIELARQVSQRIPLASQQSDFKKEIDAFLVSEDKRDNLKEWGKLLSYISKQSLGLSITAWKRLEKQYYIVFLSNDSLDIFWVANLQNTLNILLKSSELNPLVEQWTVRLLDTLKIKMQRSLREDKWFDPNYPVKKIWEDIANFLKHELALELDRFSNKDTLHAELIEWLVSIAQCLGEKDMSAILMCKVIALSYQTSSKNHQNFVSLYTLADRFLWEMMEDWQCSRDEAVGSFERIETGALILEEMIEGIKSILQDVRIALKAKPHEGVLNSQEEVKPLQESGLDKLLKGLQKLWQASIDRMGFSPPCAYSLVLLGSWARLDHSPYSDLEFLLLIGPNKGTERSFAEKLGKKEIESYFRQCFDLFLVQIELLGEDQDKRHILGDIPHRVGIHVDDILLPFKGKECFYGPKENLVEKFSLGKKSRVIEWSYYFEAARMKDNLQAEDKGYSITAAAASYDARFFYGNEILFRDYLRERQKILSVRNGPGGYSSQVVLALSFFRKAILSNFMRQGYLFQEMQVKTRFLYVVSGIIKVLSMYHGLNENGLTVISTRERCRQLVFNGIIDKKLGVCLEIAYDFSNRLRTLSHCNYDNEYDYWLLFGDDPRVISKRLWQHYPQIWKETIGMLHEIIYPLHNAFADWVDEAQITFSPIRLFSLAPEVLDRCQDTLANEGMNIAHRFGAVAGEILTGDKTGQGTFLCRLSQRWWQFLLVTLLHLSPKERATLWIKILPKLSREEREQFIDAWDVLMQRPLGLEQEHGYFSKAEIKALREEVAPTFVVVAPHVIFEDGWTILSYRKQKQWQQAVNGLFSAGIENSVDLADIVVQKKQVVVGCLDPKLNGKELRKRVHQGEAISRLFVLNPAVQMVLQHDEIRAFAKAREKPSGKRHIVLFFENTFNGEIHHFCLKIFPENPGMEYFITQVQYTLGGDELPDVWLWRIYTQFYPDGIAALLMEDVRGLRYTPEDKISMLNLSQVRKENPGILFAIDGDSFTRHFLRVTWTTPEDDKPNDYYVIPGNRKNVALRGRYILHRVDNERSLYVSELLEHKRSLFGQSAYNPEEADRVLKLKTVIYCMENMGAPLSEAVLKNFMQLDMKKTFKRWLELVGIWNVGAREVFKPAGIMFSMSRPSSSSALLSDEEPFRIAHQHYEGNFYRHGVFHFAPNHLHAKEADNFCLTVLPMPGNKLMEMYLLLKETRLFFDKNVKIASSPTGLETLKAVRPDQYKHYHDNLNPAIRIGIKETDIRRLSEGVFRRFNQATEGGYNRDGESSQVYRSMVTSGLGELMRAEDFEAVLQGRRSEKEAAIADTVEGFLFTLEKYELSKDWSDEAQMIQQILLDRFWEILAAPIIEPISRFGFFRLDDPVGKRLNQILTEFSNLSHHNKLELRRHFLGGRKKKEARNVAAFHPEVKSYILHLLLNEPAQEGDPVLRRLNTSEFAGILKENDLLRLLQKHGETLEKAILVTQFNPYKIREFKKCLEACSNLKHLELKIVLREEKIISARLQSIEHHFPQLQTLILSGFLNLEVLSIKSPKLMHLTLRNLLNLNFIDITVEKLRFIELCHCHRVYSHVFQGEIIERLGLDQKMPLIQLENMPGEKSFLMRLLDEMLRQEFDMSSKITLASQFTLRQWKGLECVFYQECNAKEYQVCLDAPLDKEPDLKQLCSNPDYRNDFAKALIMIIKFLGKTYSELEAVEIQFYGESTISSLSFETALRQVSDPEIKLRIFYNGALLYRRMAIETDFSWQKKRSYKW